MARSERIRRQLLAHVLGLRVGLLRDQVHERARRPIAHGELQALGEQRRQPATVDVRGRRLLRGRIDPLHPPGENLSVLRPHRVVERERRRVVTHADDDRHVLGRHVVVGLVGLEDVPGELDRVGKPLRVPRIEDDAMLRRVVGEPFVLLVVRRLPRARPRGRRWLRRLEAERRRGRRETREK